MASVTINIPTSLPSLPLTFNGGATPVKAELSGPGGKAVDVALGATANVGGTGTPIGLEAGFRNNTVTFKLFGFLPLLTIKIR